MTALKIVIVTILTGISVLFAYNTASARYVKPMKCLWTTTEVQLRSRVTGNEWGSAQNVSMCWCFLGPRSAEYWAPDRVCGK